MKVSKHTEKQLDARIKSEIKTVNKALTKVEASIPVQLHKKCKPLEDKIMILIGSMDDMENEIDDIVSTTLQLTSRLYVCYRQIA